MRKLTALYLLPALLTGGLMAHGLTFGLLVPTFPRDPVEFNNYREHMAIGQIIEPLVSSDQYGNITPALAGRWEIMNGGKTIRFYIRPNAVFSNGEQVTAEDAAASIARHWKNPVSQSFPLLANIAAIRAASESAVEIELKQPQVAIFKILGRDHLGIMPKGWKFSVDSGEPYVGSGPYRLVKKEGKWIYVRNPRHHRQVPKAILEWEVQFSPRTPVELESAGRIPDYAPTLVAAEVAALKKNPKFDPASFAVRPRFSFVQMSAWSNPHSASHDNRVLRHIKMGAVRALFERRVKALGASKAFGMIPYGVAGHLTSEVKFEHLKKGDVEAAAAKYPDARVVRVNVPARLREEIFAPEDVKAVETELGVVFQTADRDLEKERKGSGVDIIVDRWAGGFNDPEGFIPIIIDIAKMPLGKYLGSLDPLFIEASTEQNWTKRAELFRKLDHDLVLEERLVPGWKTEVFTLLRNSLAEIDSNLRYTPRLTDVSSL